MPAYVLGFEKYLHRTLTRFERSIIAPLERMRQRGKAIRAMFIDNDSEDSRPILCAYMRYLHDCIYTYPAAMVMAPTYAEGRKLMGYDRRADGEWLHIGSGAAPDSMRGIDFRMALLLDSDCFDVDEDKAYDLQYDALDVVLGTVFDLPGFVLIIHAHTDNGYRAIPINPTIEEFKASKVVKVAIVFNDLKVYKVLNAPSLQIKALKVLNDLKLLIRAVLLNTLHPVAA